MMKMALARIPSRASAVSFVIVGKMVGVVSDHSASVSAALFGESFKSEMVGILDSESMATKCIFVLKIGEFSVLKSKIRHPNFLSSQFPFPPQHGVLAQSVGSRWRNGENPA